MELNGREIADNIKEDIKKRVGELHKKGIIPTLAIITVGKEDSWQAYVFQKQKVAKTLGIQAKLFDAKSPDELFHLIKQLNQDKTIHGIIVQRPMPQIFSKEKVTQAILSEKDVDGFREDSQFGVPVWLATQRFLSEAAKQNNKNISEFLSGKTVTVLGKGETAGTPIILGLQKLGTKPHVIDSKTINPDRLFKTSDIIISAVGKPVIKRDYLKKGAFLIGVGLYRGENGKLRSDYLENEIKDAASFYTPTPGGVGPVNLSYLFKNLVTATESQTI